jgi:hypothetical protein
MIQYKIQMHPNIRSTLQDMFLTGFFAKSGIKKEKLAANAAT